MFAAGKTAAVSGAAPDGQFNYVTMLLHGDGTNGAQNNTFLDSGPNTLSITRNGNTTQGSFSPYGSNWSNYFGGSSDWLNVASNAGLSLGTGNYTIETFVFPANSNASNKTVWTTNWGANGSMMLTYDHPAVGAKKFGVFDYTINSGAPFLTSSSTYEANQFLHVALVRSGTTATLYVNGVSQASATQSTNLTRDVFGVGSVYTGSATETWIGYISNIRLVKGTAVYTSAFTPSTTPLTAISGTSLLTCQSNRFVDTSASPLTITVNGTPSVQRFNPFGTSTAYSTSVIGGSGYFDGSGDSLSLPNNVALDFGTGDFTIEVWIYPTSLPTSYQCVFITCNNTGSAGGIGLFTQSTGEIEVYDFAGNGAVFSTSGFNLKTNQWTNIAVTRSGSTNTLYKNGVSFATATNSSNYNSSTDTVIGNSTTASQTFYGYISALRVLKGTAQAPTITTPPTNITNTSLLLNMTNGAIFDNAMMNDLETVGNAQISTSVKKYGTGSIAFDGTGDALIAAYTPNFAFSSGNFTIEFWLYINTTSGTPIVFDMRDVGGSQTPVIYLNGSALVYYTNSGVRITGGTLSTGTWYHVAVCRSGTSTKMFLDGTQIGSTYTDSTNYSGGNLWLGSYSSGGFDLNGYIDDLRITKGYARYTATFTPPTAALSDTGPY